MYLSIQSREAKTKLFSLQRLSVVCLVIPRRDDDDIDDVETMVWMDGNGGYNQKLIIRNQPRPAAAKHRHARAMTKEIFGRQPPQTESSNLPYKRAKGEQAGTHQSRQSKRVNLTDSKKKTAATATSSVPSARLSPSSADDQQTRART